MIGSPEPRSPADSLGPEDLEGGRLPSRTFYRPLGEGYGSRSPDVAVLRVRGGPRSETAAVVNLLARRSRSRSKSWIGMPGWPPALPAADRLVAWRHWRWMARRMEGNLTAPSKER